MSSIARTPNQASPGIPHEDWDDVDSPELTDAELAELRPASEMPPEVFALLPKRRRGRPKSENAKVNVTLRLDPRLVDAYKATGAGWQTRMQEALAKGLEPVRPAYRASSFVQSAVASERNSRWLTVRTYKWGHNHPIEKLSDQNFDCRNFERIYTRKHLMELKSVVLEKSLLKASKTKRPKRDYSKKVHARFAGWGD